MQAISDRFNAPTVFAHNDLLSGNFMYNEDEGAQYLSWTGSFHFVGVVKADVTHEVSSFF